MELTFISGTKLGSVIEIEYTIGYDGEGPIPSDPSRFKIWQESIFFKLWETLHSRKSWAI